MDPWPLNYEKAIGLKYSVSVIESFNKFNCDFSSFFKSSNEDDFEYIRKGYECICNRLASLDKREPYRLVKKIVKQLKKEPNDQKCSHDLTSKRLIYKSPKM